MEALKDSLAPAEALEELKEKFLASGDLELMDGSRVTPEEMWEVVCLPFTGKYKHLMDFRSDLGLVNAFKLRYLQLSCLERLRKAHDKGIPVVFTFGGGMGFPGGELVYGCGAVTYGLTNYFNEVWWNENWALQEEAHRWSSFESCPGEPPVALMARDGFIPTDLIISGTGIFGDLPCANQLIRRWPIPLHFVDIPYNGKGKEWAIEYLAEQYQATVERISEISGKKVTIEDLNKGIKMMNDLYAAYREYVDIVTSAETPPVASLENLIVTSCVFDYCSDPVALRNAIKAVNEELKERVRNGVPGAGVAHNPVRIYMCEKFPSPPALNFADDLGAVMLGPEVSDSYYMCDPIPSDTGDPCRAMAEWSLERSPWSSALPLEERTSWVLKMVEKYRPEGVLFTAVWGCQFDPQYARYIGDAIKKEFGIPYMMNILEDVPVEIGKDGRYQMKGSTRTRLEGFIEMLKARRRER